MRIYVDFDDVLCETARALSKLASDMFGRHVPYEQIEHFNLQQSFQLNDAEIKELMHTAHDPKFLMELAETQGAKSGLEKLLASKNEVTIVTGRPVTTDSPTRTWLERYAFPALPILYVDKYHRARPDQLLNGQRALSPDDFARIPFDVAVDDSPMALDLLASRDHCRIFVFARPWNKAYALRPSMQRVCGWTSLVEAIHA